MHSTVYMSPLAVAVALTLNVSAYAASPIDLNQAQIDTVHQNFSLALPGHKLAAGMSVNRLDLIRQHTDKNHMNHIRMQQYYMGYKVFGGYAIMHSLQNAQDLAVAKSGVTMNGKVFTGLQEELGQADKDFVKNAQKALNRFKSGFAGKTIQDDEVNPLVYIDENNHAHWAYQMSMLVVHKDKIPERPTAIVDAKTGKVFVQWNDIKTMKMPVKGKGYGGNSKMGVYEFGKDLPLLEISRDVETEKCYMETTAVKVVDMQHSYYSKNAPMVFACAGDAEKGDSTYWTGYKADGYDKDNGAASPTNDAMYAGYVIKHLYSDWYKTEVLENANGTPMQLVMRVHYGTGYENAYWDGKQMTFGDGDKMMYPLVSLGVGAHEISHGFTEQHSGLMYYGQSGGMNEAFSDIAAQAAEHYSLGASSWMIGAEIMKEDSGWDALRYMDKPSRDGSSIDTADQYYGGLDVHYSSGVYNHLFFIMSHKQGWDTRKAFDVMVKANMDYWTPYTNFKDGACGILNAAKDLGYSQDEIKDSLKEVAINYDSCVAK